MTTYTGLRITGQAIQLCRRVASLPATGAYVGEPVVIATTGATYEWNGSAWSPKGQAAPPTGIPVGGLAGQVLTKATGADYDTVWAAGGGGGGGWGGNIDGGTPSSGPAVVAVDGGTP